MPDSYSNTGKMTSQRYPRGRVILLFLPLLACLAAMLMMAPGRLEGRDDVPRVLRRITYDESDLAALALRGANAEWGRLPGRQDEPYWKDFKDLEVELAKPAPPLHPRYYLEYPTPTLLLFRLGYRFVGVPDQSLIHPAIQDAQHVTIAYYTPTTLPEWELWHAFRVAVKVDMLLMALAWIITMVVVAQGYKPGETWGGPVWLMVLPGALFFAVNRFDALPTMFTAIGFSCLGRGYRGYAGIAFGLGVTFKMFPLLFMPIVVRYLGWRLSLKLVLAFGLTVLGGFAIAYGMTDLEGAIGPVKVQLSRKLTPNNWTLYDHILPVWLGESGTIRLGLVAALSGILFITKPANIDVVLRRCGIILTLFVALAVFWSPQWIIWFLPLLVPLCRTRPSFRWFVLAQDLITYFAFPCLFWIIWQTMEEVPRGYLVMVMVFVRAGMWLMQAIWLGLPNGVKDWSKQKEDFISKRSELVKAYCFQVPERGLKITSGVAVGDAVFVVKNDKITALQAVMVEVEPVDGAGLEDVEAARQTRTITAMFTLNKNKWVPTGKAVYNLMPEEVAKRLQ